MGRKRVSVRKPPMRLSKKGYWYVNLDGKQHHLGKDRDDAARIYNRLIVESSSRTGKDQDDGFTIKILCDAFMAYASQRFNPKSGHWHNLNKASQLLTEGFGNSPISEFGPIALQILQRRFARSGVSRQYVNKITSRIRTIFKWGVSQEIVSPGILVALSAVLPVRYGEMETRESKTILPALDEDIISTVDELGPTIADMVRVQRLTGMRPSEICEMRLSEVDRTNSLWVYKKSHHKNAWRGMERSVFFGQASQKILEPYLKMAEEDGNDFLFSPNRSTKGRVKSDCYDRKNYAQAIARAAKRAGVSHWSPNQLRHSAGTEIRRRYGIEAACAVLGHESISTTEIYAERNESLARRVAEEIG
ncbi:MAG: site-specific integrase [Thermoguttaceae bacterium]|nr:site-specific integrase [Thermoguttaceae bacterium]